MADPSTSPRLTILGGALSGRELTLDEAVDNILIGSDASCRFHLDHPGVSPIHARLWVDWQGVTVYDTGAPEGVYLNDDRVERSAPVRNGDILWLGQPGGDGVVMIQCRVPPRAGAPPVVTLPVVAPADAGATLVAAAPDLTAAEAVTETVAFATPDETIGPSASEPETLWLTPDTVEDAASTPEPTSAAAPPAYVEPFESAPLDDDFAASTIVLHAEPAPEEPAPPAPAQVDADATLRVTEDFADEAQHAPDVTQIDVDAPVKFEIDAPPPALAGAPAVFEDDIEEPQPEPIEATVVMDEPPSWEAPATVLVPPPPPEAPTPVAPPSAAVAPAAPRAATPVAPPPAAPAPVAMPAAAAPPVTAVPRPVPAATKRSAPSSSSAGRWIGLAALALLLIGGGLFAVYRFVLNPPAPSASTPPAATTAPPVTLAEASAAPVEPVGEPTPAATPIMDESVTIVSQPSPSAPTPKPSVTPTPRGVPSAAPSARPTSAPVTAQVDPRAQAAAQAAALVAQGDAALGEQRPDAALAAYNQALQLDPQNAQASAGRARAQAAAADARRTFVAGRSTLIGARSGKKGPAGFDAEDVEVAKSPDYSGRLEFETEKRSIKPGETWSVRVFLVNDGKKDFKIQSLSATASVNGAKAPLPASAGVREIATQKRAQVAELSGTWKEGTSAWSLEVSITSSHGEVVRNTLSWR